jgi:hypothetical protein
LCPETSPLTEIRENSQLISPGVGIQEPTIGFETYFEEKPTGPTIPSMIHIHTLPKNRYKFELEGHWEGRIEIEGNFNNWGQDKNQNWRLDTGLGETNVLFIDNPADNGCLHYRFRANGKSILDPNSKMISILPGVGICSTIKRKVQYQISMRVFLNGHPSAGDRKSGIWNIKSYCASLSPVEERITFQKDGAGDLAFSFNMPSDNEPLVDEPVILTWKEDPEVKVEIPVKVSVDPAPIFVEPRMAEMRVDQDAVRGEKIIFQVPLISRGIGCINLVFGGNGVAQKEKLTSVSPEPKEQSITLSLDTSGISPNSAKHLRVQGFTDSKIANKRHFEFIVRLNLIRLVCFPVLWLNWSNISWQKQESQLIEFYRSDTMGPVKRVEAEIPDDLISIIKAEQVKNMQYCLRFSIEKNSRLQLNDQLNGVIHISAYCQEGLKLTKSIPIRVGFLSTNSTIMTQIKEENYFVQLLIQNNGPNPLEIFSIRWEKNNFVYRKPLYEEGKNPGWPIVPVGEERLLVFDSRITPDFLLFKEIADVILIHSNSINIPFFSQEVKLKLRPKIMAAFLFCKGKTSSIW